MDKIGLSIPGSGDDIVWTQILYKKSVIGQGKQDLVPEKWVGKSKVGCHPRKAVETLGRCPFSALGDTDTSQAPWRPGKMCSN